MTVHPEGVQIRVRDAVARLPGPAGERFAAVLATDSVSIELYAPRGTDPQSPHDRDEVYVVLEGWGDFVCGGARYVFGPGNVFFVPAGVVHRFEHFGDDCAVWAIFAGVGRT